jgi:hypothetical protein
MLQSHFMYCNSLKTAKQELTDPAAEGQVPVNRSEKSIAKSKSPDCRFELWMFP